MCLPRTHIYKYMVYLNRWQTTWEGNKNKRKTIFISYFVVFFKMCGCTKVDLHIMIQWSYLPTSRFHITWKRAKTRGYKWEAEEERKKKFSRMAGKLRSTRKIMAKDKHWTFELMRNERKKKPKDFASSNICLLFPSTTKTQRHIISKPLNLH